ncbi:helix-turn-helix domain-containing protein [Algoriphagus lutimaris]|uniref:hypothetical protein n=1 Tax=Algoriphagus lutimaris TaxID=613197 RepID=UPI00293DA00C|nr:hypothetical protein [Algoriphagus lutimaris]
MISYKWDNNHVSLEGIYCIFNPHFFAGFGNIQKYEIFHPNGVHVFELTDEEVEQVFQIFEQMNEEFQSEYKYKFDRIRNLILELVHFAMKPQPAELQITKKGSASLRIASLFLELLERQFPIDDSHSTLRLRTPSQFADHLNIHVNHLNRSLKEMTQKSTSQLIADRIL